MQINHGQIRVGNRVVRLQASLLWSRILVALDLQFLKCLSYFRHLGHLTLWNIGLIIVAIVIFTAQSRWNSQAETSALLSQCLQCEGGCGKLHVPIGVANEYGWVWEKELKFWGIWNFSQQSGVKMRISIWDQFLFSDLVNLEWHANAHYGI